MIALNIFNDSQNIVRVPHVESMDGVHSQRAMVPIKSRSLSNTAVPAKTRKRPQSRASTTSIQSAATQSVPDQQYADQLQDYQKHWYENQTNAHQQQQRFESMEHQISPEDMVMRSASQLQNPREYGIDPALEAAVNHSLEYPQGGPYRPDNTRHSLPADGYGTSFAEDDSPMLEGRSDEQDEVDSLGGNGATRKVPKSSAANEMEMRQLFHTNKHRTLPEVARELHGNERGPQSERTRQVFAMLWINEVCDKGKGSVPRGRVYANYVSRCATERVTVLNPASFGKLVRVLFPGLKTRRLGVRGESKYHYVNFSLKEDQPDLIESQNHQQIQNLNEPANFPPETSTHPHLPADRAVFPSPEIPHDGPERYSRRSKDQMQSHSLYSQPVLQGTQQLESSAGKIEQRLRFAPPNESAPNDYEPITLPKIEPHIPPGTDPDSASALTALYRSHCTSLVDAVRFVKQKTFFHLFTSFHGTLTMPIQKLFAHPSIAPWIEECDFIMYQKMMRVVAHLTLEVVPQAILDILQEISGRLVPHIQNSFNGQPAHVIYAKVAPATLFAGLLDRMCRVNLTAHACANMLSHPPNRDQMYEDWITMVRLRKVAECVPERAMDDVVSLLLNELRELLDPVAVPWEVEGLTPYGEIALRNGRQQHTNINANATTENVLDRWVNFLNSIPGKFPYASPIDIVWCVQCVGTAVMRDLTIRSGQSFGAWWVTKCWIDEMISFMAEKGGFMEYKITRANGYEASGQSYPNGIASQHKTQYNSTGQNLTHILHDDKNMRQSISVPGPMDPKTQAELNAAAGHDDSGIGMRTPEDDFSLGKFGFSDTQISPANAGGLARP